MLTSGIDLLNFKEKKKNLKIRKKLKILLKNKDQVIKSLTLDYKDSFNPKRLINYKKFLNFRVIGMGGSTLGTQAIYDFLNHKIKKKFKFIDNLQTSFIKQDNKKKYSNIVVSKSGNTIETIENANIIINKKDKNIFITENKKSYLFELSQKLKAEIIYHNNFIGGRYSVLSEVGMLPAELMGLNPNNFRQLNNLVKNKNF